MSIIFHCKSPPFESPDDKVLYKHVAGQQEPVALRKFERPIVGLVALKTGNVLVLLNCAPDLKSGLILLDGNTGETIREIPAFPFAHEAGIGVELHTARYNAIGRSPKDGKIYASAATKKVAGVEIVLDEDTLEGSICGWNPW